ncbi:hypothetical protein DFH08DRAFT_701987, partial [Mycena albidolilacea]
IAMDNASNNDTLMDHLAIKFAAVDITFDPIAARIRCMPHTAHLAAIKLLEAIGAISKSSGKKAGGRQTSYQDAVTAPLAREHDDDAEGDDDDEDDEEFDSEGRNEGAVAKLRSVGKACSNSKF